MVKKTIFIYFLFICSFYKAQTDSSVVTPKEEPVGEVITPVEEPINDSLLSPAPTDTISKKVKKQPPEPPALGEVFKPKVSLGVGMLSYDGDTYNRHFQAPWTARIGYDLNISQRLYKAWQLNFNILFGKLAANEWNEHRQENFISEIRAGGVSLMYDFGNFIPNSCSVRPWISVGVNSFEFLSKTDLKDKNGNTYYYWSDGSIKNKPEGSAGAVNLNRDYVYETDIRESNKDGFGKYQERAWAFPVGFGALMKVTDRVDFKIGMQYYFTTTDYIDGISNKSIDHRAGNKRKDNFVYTSVALQYDLVWNRKPKTDTLPKNHFDGIDWLAIDNADYDSDGVKDWDDNCQGTPEGVKVNASGCPEDDDKDGVPNYGDDELTTPSGMAVNMRGVSLDDAYWQAWYDQYMDSGDVAKNVEIVENFYKRQNDSIAAAKSNSKVQKANKNAQIYTVELARYNGPVPAEEMSYLLSIGDVRSTLLPDNTTVLYTAGTYQEISNAIKRRDEFRAEGNPRAQVGYFKNGDLITMNEEEIKKAIEEGNAIAANTNTSSANNNGNNPNVNGGNSSGSDNAIAENEFAKGDIVYRVQLGAYKHRISKSVFKNAGDNILELKADENYYRYATKGFKTIQEAAALKADLVIEGYGDAFITAYKDGKRIPMSATKATMQTNEKENINEIKAFSSVDKNLISFKVQLGALRKAGSNDMEEKTKDLKDLEKQSTTSGMIRYTSGVFQNYSKADEYRAKLADEGFMEAFVIAIFKGEIISIQEAQELLK